MRQRSSVVSLVLRVWLQKCGIRMDAKSLGRLGTTQYSRQNFCSNSSKAYSVEPDVNVNGAIAGHKKLCTRDRYARSSSVQKLPIRPQHVSRSLFCFKNVSYTSRESK